ncbi:MULTISPECIES: cysteine synthase A [Salinibaculum]|uniref:cysteine synthase A n=1 Tax=Salinibaculum TaxID=2732368 RepID=UPI0030CAB3B1
MTIADDVTDLIGDTPLVRLDTFAPNLVGKLEFFNPANSVKDRIGTAMLDHAEEQGWVDEDTTIVEPTSGNTGIGLAAASAARGYDMVLVMPDSMSEERRTLLSALGAEVVLTDGDDGMDGAIEYADALADELDDSFVPQQFQNAANPAIHRETTGPEIWEATDGEVDAVVAGVGTGGTITGVSEYLKEDVGANVRSIAVEPANSAVLSGEEPGSHSLQGIGAGFVPDILRTDLLDDAIPVPRETAVERSRELAEGEGVLAGISAGAAVEAGRQVAADNPDDLVVAIVPDFGERYLSTDLYEATAVTHVAETDPEQLAADLTKETPPQSAD